MLFRSSSSTAKPLDYADLILPSAANVDSAEAYDQPQPSALPADERTDLSAGVKEHAQENNERSSTILYTDIDFHQTQRRDRIAQFAANAKLEDQSPPFVL